MAGKWITNHQIRLYMKAKQQGRTQKIAAAAGGFSERSSYRIENQQHQPAHRARYWKTREDPFEEVWDN